MRDSITCGDQCTLCCNLKKCRLYEHVLDSFEDSTFLSSYLLASANGSRGRGGMPPSLDLDLIVEKYWICNTDRAQDGDTSFDILIRCWCSFNANCRGGRELVANESSGPSPSPSALTPTSLVAVYLFRLLSLYDCDDENRRESWPVWWRPVSISDSVAAIIGEQEQKKILLFMLSIYLSLEK